MVKYIITENMKTVEKNITTLIGKMKNMEPVYRLFLPEYQKSIKDAFVTDGMIYGKRWKKLNEKYRKQKIRKVGNKNLLKYNDDMFNATQGGPGSITEINKNYMLFGIDLNAIPYARIHQYGGMTGRKHAAYIPQRPYIFGYDNKTISNRATTKLRELLLKQIFGPEGFQRG